jgi:hypothetical protein
MHMDVINAYHPLLKAVAILMLLTAGCSRTPREATYTVDYYRARAEIRAEKLRDCSNNPGDLRNTPNCVNAAQAEAVEGIGSLRNLPPMGLSTGREAATKKEPQR